MLAVGFACSGLSVVIDAQGAPASVVRIPFPRYDGTLTPYTFRLGYPLVTLIYDTLLWRDAQGVPRPWLARSVVRSDQGRRVTVRLREGVRWHDGQPVTADDVAFTFRLVGERSPGTPELANVEQVQALDRATVAFDLRRPSLGFEQQPLGDLPILPQHLWAGLPPGQVAPRGLAVGSGPYRLVRAQRTTGYELRANRAYFKGRPEVERIEVPIIHQAQRNYAALRERRVDMLPFTLPRPAADEVTGGAPGIALRAGSLYSGTALLLNLRRPTFDRPAARRAVAAALPLLQQSGQTITRTRNCVSCHQHPLVAMTVGLARKHGFNVDETIAGEERAHVLKDMGARVRPLLLGTGIDPTLSVHVLAGLAAEDEPASRITDALVHYLVLRQRKDGRWQQENYRPPDEASDFQFTALAVRGLRTYAPKGRSREIAVRIDQARRWLQSAEPTDTTDRGFQLLGLGWAKAEPGSITKAVTKLVGGQREDGGWAQLPTLASDAYATGLALLALHEGGGVAVDHPAYRRGVEYLLRTQQADGSWFVASRSFPIVEYSKSGFPHGRSQFISASATCWATMALTLTTRSSPHVQCEVRGGDL
jgi:hypothetical protein